MAFLYLSYVIVFYYFCFQVAAALFFSAQFLFMNFTNKNCTQSVGIVEDVDADDEAESKEADCGVTGSICCLTDEGAERMVRNVAVK